MSGALGLIRLGNDSAQQSLKFLILDTSQVEGLRACPVARNSDKETLLRGSVTTGNCTTRVDLWAAGTYGLISASSCNCLKKR